MKPAIRPLLGFLAFFLGVLAASSCGRTSSVSAPSPSLATDDNRRTASKSGVPGCPELSASRRIGSHRKPKLPPPPLSPSPPPSSLSPFPPFRQHAAPPPSLLLPLSPPPPPPPLSPLPSCSFSQLSAPSPPTLPSLSVPPPPPPLWDLNGDGVPDSWVRYDSAGRVVESSEDRNHDRRPDSWLTFDPPGVLKGSDSDFDGGLWATKGDFPYPSPPKTIFIVND